MGSGRAHTRDHAGAPHKARAPRQHPACRARHGLQNSETSLGKRRPFAPRHARPVHAAAYTHRHTNTYTHTCMHQLAAGAYTRACAPVALESGTAYRGYLSRMHQPRGIRRPCMPSGMRLAGDILDTHVPLSHSAPWPCMAFCPLQRVRGIPGDMPDRHVDSGYVSMDL